MNDNDFDKLFKWAAITSIICALSTAAAFVIAAIAALKYLGG